MKRELEEILVKKYPNLYCDYNGDPTKTCMCWGFECGEGWFKIIDELSEELEKLGATAEQVKQKFGSLHFYFSVPAENSNAAHEAVDRAEAMSEKTCENCGADSSIRSQHGWLSTVCDDCLKKRR